VTNLGLDANYGFQLEGNRVAILVSEGLQGRDLNGDGDRFDAVLHVVDAPTGITTNVGAAGGFSYQGDRIVFFVFEGDAGSDLNGDGDPFDAVLHVFDVSTGTTINLGFAAAVPTFGPNQLAFWVHERAQGSTDLNGDGDALDIVLHVRDFGTGAMTNLGLAGTFDSPQFEFQGRWLAFLVSEREDGARDLNGDGDADDLVLHLSNALTGGTRNLGLALSAESPAFQIHQDRLALLVSETAQGGDLNDDDDATDFVVHVSRPDGAVAQVQAEPPANPSAPAQVRATLANVGIEDIASLEVAFFLDLNSNRTLDVGEPATTVTATNVAADTSQTLVAQFSDPPAGSYLAVAIADPSNGLPESDESNNCAETSLEIVLPDLIIVPAKPLSSLTAACSGTRPRPTCPQYDVTLATTVANVGDVSAGNAQVAFEVSSNGVDFTRIGGPVSAGALSPDESTTVTTLWRNVPPGSYWIRIIVDPTNVIREMDETNNFATLPMTVPMTVP